MKDAQESMDAELDRLRATQEYRDALAALIREGASVKKVKPATAQEIMDSLMSHLGYKKVESNDGAIVEYAKPRTKKKRAKKAKVKR